MSDDWYAEAQLAQNDRVDGDVTLVGPQPVDDARFGTRLRRFAQDVGVDQTVGNRTAAARLLRIGRSTLYQRLAQLEAEGTELSPDSLSPSSGSVSARE